MADLTETAEYGKDRRQKALVLRLPWLLPVQRWLVQRNWPELLERQLVTPVSVPVSYAPFDFVARKYPVNYSADALNSTPDQTVNDQQNTREGGVVAILDTAAFRIAQDVYPTLLSEPPTRTMEVFWGTTSNPENTDWMTGTQPQRQSLSTTLLKGYEKVVSNIPYHRTLYVRDLLQQNSVTNTAHQEAAAYLHNKVILYGAHLQGINDLVFTPTRNQYPGVYFHAMALDNLLRWGSNYKSEDAAKGTPLLLTHAWLILLTVFPVALATAAIHALGAYPNSLQGKYLKRLQAALRWAWRSHPGAVKTLISVALFFWFGFWAWYEFNQLHYAASLPAAYIQLIVIGFFLEKTGAIDWCHAQLRKLAGISGLARRKTRTQANDAQRRGI